MATVLRLDKNALMYLLEVMGEEFKVELSKAVVANASRAIVRNLIPEKMEEVVKAAAEAEVAEQIGHVTGSWSKRTVTVNNDVRDAISDLVKAKAGELRDEAYNQFLEEFNRRIDNALQNVEYLVAQEVQQIKIKAIKKEVERQLAEIVAAINTEGE